MSRPAYIYRLRHALGLILGFALWLSAGASWASPHLVIIANPASGIERLNRDEVAALYMGRVKKLPSGITALPIDQNATNPEKARFYRDLLNKDLTDINSYWARLIFSGQASPPRQADNTADVIDIVSTNKGAIGYIPRQAADRRIRIILDLGAAP
jgi:ABC-type phosphate transport system substrate-binding protein